jgi:hypothetical protein
MSTRLDRLERQIETLVEGSFARMLGTEVSASGIAGQVARAMEDNLKWDEIGKAYAPDQFALTMHPDEADVLLERAPSLHLELAQGLLEVARANGYMLAREPHITIAADPTLPRWEVRVIAWHSANPLEFTQSMPEERAGGTLALPRGAFLIIDGRRHFALDRMVINIGRRLDNQLILEDAHVSRTHAQLRAREGRYVLFDLGSTAGTRVNGRQAKQHILQAGDVISIAGIRMVYGEDPGGPPDSTPAYTPPFPPRPAGDQRTRTSDWEDSPKK